MFGLPPEETPADIRGLPDCELLFVFDTDLIMLALARLFEAQGIDDRPLIDELYRRSRR